MQRVRWIDEADEPELERALAFAASVGTPRRTTVTQYREEAVRNSEHVGQAVVEDDDGSIRGAVFAHVFAPIGRDVAQVNVFTVPGDDTALRLAVDALVGWARERHLRAMLAHVTDPAEGFVEALEGQGFARVGSRSRLSRKMAAEDRSMASVELDGIRIVPLEEHPELEHQVQGLWAEAHRDIPSALAFDAEGAPAFRDELGIGPDDPFPSSLLIAIAASGDVVGIAYLHVHLDPVGHGGHRFTGVAREARGRGVARALKVELIRWAAANGLTVLHASNDDGNDAMRAINDALGYEQRQRIELMRRPVDP